MKKLRYFLFFCLFSLSCRKEDTTANTIQYDVVFSATEGGTINTTGGRYDVGTSITITPVSYGTYSYITIEAIPTYPATMHSWRTAPNGGGSQISTSTSINLTVSDYTSQGSFFAHFNN